MIAPCPLCEFQQHTVRYFINNCNVLECCNCGFIFVFPVPTKKELRRFYEKFDYHDLEKAEKTIRSDSIQSLAKINRFLLKRENTILDVGCGRGFFLDEARRIGLKTSGIDLSDRMIRYAKDKLKLNIKREDILKLSGKTKYDIVSLNQVIEHFSNPKDVVDQCYKILNNKGILYIATPNIECLSARIHKERFDYLIPPEHLVYFNPKTLYRMLRLLKFDVIYMGTWSYPQELAGVIKELLGKNKKIQKKNTFPHNTVSQKQNNIKILKYLIFDKLFCTLFYKLMNIGFSGATLEVVARRS